MIHSNLFQFDKKVDWKTIGSGIQRQVLGYDNKVMLVKVKFEKDSCGKLHNHANSQVTYVESGTFEMTMGDTKRIIAKGDGYCATPYTLHRCVCIEAGMLVDAFSPLR